MKNNKNSIAIISAIAVMSVVSICVGVYANSDQHIRYKNTLLIVSDEDNSDLDLNNDNTVDVMDYCLYKVKLLNEMATTVPSVTTTNIASNTINNNSNPAPSPVVTTAKAPQKLSVVTTKVTEKATEKPAPPTTSPTVITEAPKPPVIVTEAPDPNADWYPGKGMSMRDVDPNWDGTLKWGCRTEEQMAFFEYCEKEALNRSNLDQAFNDAIAQWEYYDGPEAAIEDINDGSTTVERVLISLYGKAGSRLCNSGVIAQEICEQHGKNIFDYHSSEDSAYWTILGGSDCGGSAYATACQENYRWGLTTKFVGMASIEHAGCMIMLSPYTREWYDNPDAIITEEHIYEGSWYRFDRDLETVKNKLREYGWEG